VSKSDEDIIQKLRNSQSVLRNAVNDAGEVIAEWDSAKTSRRTDNHRKTEIKNRESDNALLRERNKLHEEYILKQQELDRQKKRTQSENEELKHEIELLKNSLNRREYDDEESRKSMKESISKLEEDFRQETEALENMLREEREYSAEIISKKDEELKKIKDHYEGQQKVLKQVAMLEETNNSLVYRCREAEEQFEALTESLSGREKKHAAELALLREELTDQKTVLPRMEEKLKAYEIKIKQQKENLQKIIAEKDAEIRKMLANEKKVKELLRSKIAERETHKKFKCSICGTEVPENAKFCHGCGHEFK